MILWPYTVEDLEILCVYIYKFMYDYGEREKKGEEATQGELGKMRVIRHLIKE